jgi:ankyrin repeat protein
MFVMQDDSLWTPLLIAASAGHKEIAKMLIGNV